MTVVLLCLLVAAIGFTGYCLADLARSPARSLPKWAWAVILVVSIPWGGLAYLLLGKTRTSPAQPAASPAPMTTTVPAPASRRSAHSPLPIEVDHLSKRFGRVAAVDGLSFTAHPGRVTGFLGPNGAGKTTTMRVILGLDAPTAGTALIGGRPYREFTRPLHEVGSLLDATALPAGRSAWSHLTAVAQSNGIGRRRVTEVLELTGLGAVAGRRAGEFSLGMKQRLGLATALLGDPPALLLDEPANGLDTDGIRWIRELLRSLAAEGRTILVSSHLMSEIAVTADQLVIIGAGRLLADTSTADFLAGTQGDVLVRSPRAAELASLLGAGGATVRAEGDDAIAVTGLDAAGVGELAAAHGIALHGLQDRHASLEDAYLAITAASAPVTEGAVR